MIVEFYQVGQSENEFDSKYGVSNVSIYDWIREYNQTNPSESEPSTMYEIA